MFFARISRSLAWRLSLWYTLVFSLSTLLAFAFAWLLMSSVLEARAAEDLEEDLEEMALIHDESGPAGVWREAAREIASEGAERGFFRLFGADGALLESTDMAPWEALPETLLSFPGSEPLNRRIENAALEFDLQLASALIAPGLVLQIGESLEENAEFLDVLLLAFGGTLPFLFLGGALLGAFLSRKALAGLEQVTRTAGEIAHGKFDERVPWSDQGEEINRLVATFNGMLDRIELLIRGMREITDNIAHDLRSPLTRIRGEVEAALTSSAPQESRDYEGVLASTIEEADRLIHMINTMLDITETEAGLAPRSFEEVDLSGLVHDAYDLFQPLAAQHAIDFSCDADPELHLRGNASYLQRLLANLVDNALKYTPPGGRVSISLKRIRDKAQIQVADTGIGIPDQEQQRIFSRFYRGDASRSRPGNGLGLCLAQAIARAHWGEIEVVSRRREGSIFTVNLPLRPAD